MKRVILKLLALLVLAHLLTGYYSVAADICVNDPLKVNHIRGRVVADWQGGEEPIANAEVELTEFRADEWQTRAKVGTDEKGFFSLENIPSGKYELLVRAANFNSFGAELRLKNSKSKPDREIVVRLGVGLHDCGSARAQKIKQK